MVASSRLSTGNKDMYKLTAGTVQAMVCGKGSDLSTLFTHHFGRAQYDRSKPILTERLAAKAQPIVDALNAGTMSEVDARTELDKIRS